MGDLEGSVAFLVTDRSERLPLILYEDEHLLAVNKPAGLNTHAPSPLTGEGLYEWLRHRQPRWAALAIVHRLDKQTSGVLLFAKTPAANRSLTEQFTRHSLRKKYLLLSEVAPGQRAFRAISTLVRSGEKYLSRPPHAGGARAETRFRSIGSREGLTIVEAEAITGRTHQIRVQATEHGFPILGDTLYGGGPAARLYLHAEELKFKNPGSGTEMVLRAPADFFGEEEEDSAMIVHSLRGADLNHGRLLQGLKLRDGLIDKKLTNAYRIIHGAADGWPGWYVDRLDEFILSQAESALSDAQVRLLGDLLREGIPAKASSRIRGIHHKTVSRGASDAPPPEHVMGEAAPGSFLVHENGVQFELRFNEGSSIGLFLDQRDNRRRFLVNYVAAGFPLFSSLACNAEVLNTFAYTCGFSVCAAKAGARVTSIDLSKNYLEWGKRNFAANQLDPAAHDFIFGDVFVWLRRLVKKGRRFDVVVLDPPTFSRSKERKTFQAEKDFGQLVLAALPLLRSGGVLFAASNAAAWPAEKFLEMLNRAVHSGKRNTVQQHYVPQPPDFPITRAESAYLKTAWLRLE